MSLRISPAVVVISLALLSSACDGEATSAADTGRTTRIWVAPEKVPCEGVAPQECLQIKDSEDGEWEFFYDEIEGFNHVSGTSYILDVEITEIEDPPADASSLRYRLVDIVESS